LLASGPADALDWAQPIFNAIGLKTVGLEPETARARRMKLVANACTLRSGRASAAN
jgi:3-hydroxyisobutyrate dehydrogenase-like beta-hydroxyacid dehydrogenase